MNHKSSPIRIAVACACLASLVGTATAQTLIAHWAMDDPSTINPTSSSTPATADSSGNNYNATFEPAAGPGATAGAASALAGLNTAFEFDGTNDDLLVTTPAPLLDGLTTDFTLAAWINTNVPGTHYILGFSGTFPANNNGVRFGVYSNNTGLVLTLGGVADYELIGAAYTGPNPITSGVWHHVCVVVAGATANATFYLDGTNVGNLAGGGPAVARNAAYVIGANPIFGDFGRVNGKLDDVRVYTGTLSQAQITDLATGGAPASVDNWTLYQ